ncbi:DsrE family protein [Paucibacter sediminis]|uniref:DsrE family protein n=1 Tax=Paucibacter sediminis TaxID=3019553 RepID=A0AA95NF03_9BURK|nr:DsrE family protein [Paucibacter sp. S2-9]WIT11054.1 DsrE family protein [Paucibacter sp. S2-9]
MSIQRRMLVRGLAALGLSLSLALPAATALAADAGVKVVYHLSEGVAQAARAMGNIRNHLAADPTAKIVVVSHGAGIDFLLDGANTPQGQPFAGAIGDLAGQGVEFRVCNNTLAARKISPDKVAMEAKIVPSGVAEVARLQAREGFVYLHP